MRGSPLLRFFLLTIALAVTGFGLVKITAARDTSQSAGQVIAEERHPARKTVIPFRLLLSAPAAEIEMDTGKSIRPTIDETTISGSLEMDSKNPHIGLVIRWKNSAIAGERRFAKLTLEIPGQETFTHVFDADGDIDDFIELPMSAAK